MSLRRSSPDGVQRHPGDQTNPALRRAHWSSGVDVLRIVRDICRLHPLVHDYRMSEAIEKLSDLIGDEGDRAEFFVRNYVTRRMDTPFRGGLRGGRGKPVGRVRRACD
jgi:hypothetical protein